MITNNFQNSRIFIRPGRTDMRKSINGLCAIVQDTIRQDPFADSLFVFCNRRHDIVKLLYWDRNGFCLWQKRLEQDKFPWPDSEDEAMEIPLEKLMWLLNGVDFRKAHETLKFTEVA